MSVSLLFLLLLQSGKLYCEEESFVTPVVNAVIFMFDHRAAVKVF